MLLAFQTTATSVDDRTLDTVTLVLLVGFVVSLVALSFLLARRGTEEADHHSHVLEERTSLPTLSVETRERMERPAPIAPELSTPAWLAGVALPIPDQQLATMIGLVERLLAARRNQDLPAGLALYSPSFRARLAGQLGVPEEELAGVLAESTIEGDPPAIRSVEIVDTVGAGRTIRVVYLDRSAERYRFVRIGAQWAIDAIERG